MNALPSLLAHAREFPVAGEPVRRADPGHVETVRDGGSTCWMLSPGRSLRVLTALGEPLCEVGYDDHGPFLRMNRRDATLETLRA